MNYTITQNEDGYTNLNAADYLIQFFDLMRKGQKGWALFEMVYGGPFDIRKFTPDDFVFNDKDAHGFKYEWWELDIGNGWKLNVKITQRGYRRTSPDESELTVAFIFNGNWCFRPNVVFYSHNIVTMAHDLLVLLAESHWKNIFAAIKRRAAITIREHRNYLANPSFYDTLERELNIKVRKKK